MSSTFDSLSFNCPNDLDGSLNEAAADEIRQYHTDYNNRHSNTISFMSVITSTSGHLLFLQTHRETDRFFAASGVQFEQSDRDQFHYHCVVFSSQLKSKVGNILTCHHQDCSTEDNFEYRWVTYTF